LECIDDDVYQYAVRGANMKFFQLFLIAIAIELSGCASASPLQEIPKASDSPMKSTPPVVFEKTKEKKPWRSAVFKGIRIGQDSRKLAKAKFGKPSWSGEPQGQDEEFPEIWDNYENIDELHKKITVMSSQKDGTILAIVSDHVSDKKYLSVEEALKIFGDDYERTNYSPVPSTEPSESVEVVEDPEGSITRIEYRGDGIVLVLDSTKKLVHYIEYISESKGVKKT
jgi:hypothetical protein